MENIEKNILALSIIVSSIYLFFITILRIDTKIERFLFLSLYFIVLILGLLRPDQQHFGETGLYAWNPLGFLHDIQGNRASLIIMIINLVIFLPMYFLLAHSNIFKSFVTRLIFFEIFAFLIEFLQAKLKVGTFDLADIVLYNLSFFAGYFLFLPILKFLDKRQTIKEE